jgi:hypothetical protein
MNFSLEKNLKNHMNTHSTLTNVFKFIILCKYEKKYVPCMPYGIIKVSCLNITINYTNLIGFLIPRLVSMYIIYLVRFHQYTHPTLVVVVFFMLMEVLGMAC